MQALNNVLTLDNYDAALTLEQDTADTLTYVVANASVRAKFRPVAFRGEARAPYGDEVLLSPQSNSARKVSGVQFRSAIAGTPARVIAQLTGPGDPELASGTPFTQTLSAAGGVSGGSGSIQRIALANFPPAAPADGDVISLAVASDAEWLLIFNAGTGFWDYIGGPGLFSEVAVGAQAVATGTAAYQAVATAGPSVDLPRPGDYEIEIGFTQVAAGGANQELAMSYDIGGTGASDNDRALSAATGTTVPPGNSVARARLKTGLLAVTLLAKYRFLVAAHTGSVDMRWMRATPRRIQ